MANSCLRTDARRFHSPTNCLIFSSLVFLVMAIVLGALLTKFAVFHKGNQQDLDMEYIQLKDDFPIIPRVSSKRVHNKIDKSVNRIITQECGTEKSVNHIAEQKYTVDSERAIKEVTNEHMDETDTPKTAGGRTMSSPSATRAVPSVEPYPDHYSGEEPYSVIEMMITPYQTVTPVPQYQDRIPTDDNQLDMEAQRSRSTPQQSPGTFEFKSDIQTHQATELTEKTASTIRPRNPEIYTSQKATKLAMEYFNNAKITKSSPLRQPSVAHRPLYSKLDSTVKEDEDDPQSFPKPSKPRYTNYKVFPTSTLPPPCFRKPYALSRVCALTAAHTQAHGEAVTLEDVAKLLFSKVTLAKVKDECGAGEWCLEGEDHELYQEFGEFCDLTSCLVGVSDECLNDERRLVISSLQLLCDSSQGNVSSQCLRGVSKMLHVTMTDLYRARFRKEQVICSNAVDKDECNGPCLQYAVNLHCLQKACDNQSHIFEQFHNWMWFFTMEDKILKCQLNSSQCPRFQSIGDYTTLWDQWMTLIHVLRTLLDVKLCIGVLLGAFIAMVCRT